MRIRLCSFAFLGGDAGERPGLHQTPEQVDARLDGVLLLRATGEDLSGQDGRSPDDPDGPPRLRRDFRRDPPGDLRPLLIVQSVPRVWPELGVRADRVHLVDPTLPVHHPPDRGHVRLHAREDPAGPPEALRLLPRANAKPRDRGDHAPARGPLHDHVPRGSHAALPGDAEGRTADVDARDPLYGSRHGRPDRPDELRPPPREPGRALLQHPLARPVRYLADRPAPLLWPADRAEGIRKRRGERPPARPAARYLLGTPAQAQAKAPTP